MKEFKWINFAILLCCLISACAHKPPDVFVFEPLTQRVYEDETTHHTMVMPSPTCMDGDETKGLKGIGEPECGHGMSIMKGREILVGERPENYFNGKPWSQIQRESILVPAVESFAPIQAHMINTCQQMKCDPELEKFKVKIDSFSGLKEIILHKSP